MKMFKFALLGAAFLGLCSFVYVKTAAPVVTEELPIEQTYKKFLEKFDKVDLPYKITAKRFTSRNDFYDAESNSSSRNDKKYLGYEFGDVLPEINRGMMSRMGPDDYEAEVMLAQNKNFDAIIYSRIPSFRGGKTYYVATFDKNGKMISKMNIAGQNYSRIEDAKISKDLVINVDKYEIEGMNSDDENAKLTYKLSSSKEYMITASGNIVDAAAKNQNPQQKAIKGDIGMN